MKKDDSKKKHPSQSKNASRDAERYVGGRNAAAEAMAANLATRLFVKKGAWDERLRDIVSLAKEHGVPTEEKDVKALDAMVPDLRHQGVVAEILPYQYHDLDAVLSDWEGRDPFLILLDGVEDVRNLGAIIRTAECAGAAAVLIPEHRSARVTYATMKTAAGACAYLPVCRIGNIRQTLETLKDKGFWVVGTAMDGESNYFEANLTGPLVIVMGAEGKGMSPLTRKTCDFCVRIPMKGRTESLNVSVAAALLLFEAAKQRG